MKKIVLPVIFSALIAGCLAMIGGSNVYAYPSPAELIKKAYDNGVEKCSNDQYFKKNVSLYDVYGLESITNGGGIGTIKNPNPLEDVLSTSGIDCKTLFANHIKVSVPEYSSGNNQAINTALINLGYNGNGATSGGKTCIDISYKNANNTNGKSQPLCITSASNGALNTEEVANANGSFDTSKYDVGIYLGHCGDPLGPASVCLAWKESSGYTQVESIGNRTTPYTTLAEIQADIEKAANRLSMATQTGASDIGLFSNVTVNSPTTERGDGSYESYTYGSNPETNAGLILENFSNYSSWPAAAFTPYEKYWYYMYTLLDFYKVSIDEQSCDTVKSSSNPRAIPMHNQNGGRRWCNVTGARENGDMLVNMFSDDHFLDKEGGLDDVIAAIRSLDINSDFPDEELASISETTGEVTDPDPDQSDDTGSSTDPNDVCYGAEGTLGMSWLICPVMQTLYDGLNWVYTDVAGKFLPIEGVSFFSTDNEVYKAWQTFQTFANIIVVILLLIVIFSQLTGIGIDNYGIKKILPRLVICAILINLSYFIAQFLVDISNIIGASIGNIFGDVNVAQITDEGGALVTILGAGASLGVIAGAFAIYSNPAIILGFLLTCLSGLLAVLTMWAILVARQVGVIIAVVVSPIVFACYLLPNTSKITKGWVNLMKGLLLLYPLCALLIGGSAFVSDLFKSVSDSQIMFLAAILIRVLPFFALPTLFRKSINAMGSIGATIQGIGRSLSRGTTGAIRGTEGYKTLQKASLERQNRRRAGLDRQGNLTERGERRTRRAGGRIGRFFGMDSLQASRIARANKAREEDISSAAQLGEAVERRELARDQSLNRQDYLRQQLRTALSSGNASDYYAAVDQATKSGMKSSDIAKITREIFDGNYWGGALADEGQRGNFLQEFANRYGGSFLKKDAEQKSWAATRGGRDVDSATHPNAAGTLAGFASRGGMETADLKDNEVIDLSADRLHELLQAGIIDAAQAQRVWSSGANMDSINKLMLGAMGTRGELINKRDAQNMTSANYAGNLHGLDRQAVQALTETTPQDTVIRDVRWKNEEGEHSQTDPLIVSQATPPAQNNSPRIDMPDGTYYQNGTHYNASGQQIP